MRRSLSDTNRSFVKKKKTAEDLGELAERKTFFLFLRVQESHPDLGT